MVLDAQPLEIVGGFEMKILHISDLHLGRVLNERSLLPDQEDALRQILEIANSEHPNVVLIAGDVYDHSNPKGEAMRIFSVFLNELWNLVDSIIVIAGNHDEDNRIAYGSEILSNLSIFVSKPFMGEIVPLISKGDCGEFAIYPLPFVTIPAVNHAYEGEGNEPCKTMTCAMQKIISHLDLDASRINIMVAHQSVAGGILSGAESVNIGGSEMIDSSVFNPFDYVALGHFHGAQTLLSGKVRYCGSPLKYSFNELKQNKTVTIVEFKSKDMPPIITEYPITPLHELREMRGKYLLLASDEFRKEQDREAYFRIILTDEEIDQGAPLRLKSFYPNILEYRYENSTTMNIAQKQNTPNLEEKTPIEIVSSFFKQQLGKDITPEQMAYATKTIDDLLNL